ncbi:MAG: OadG family protein [Chlorobium sp.]|uniref:OadG family transporter subunit n=1 Tax=Chlorobium sp. TaxID=1095 RepID=UPI0025C5498B|nr:OadG family transporter subunit [Chlorobium sp.]MCF8382758.1 OadG family protein [Chlorobium sp.]
MNLFLWINLDPGAISTDHLMLAVIGYSVVFLALLLLYLFFRQLPKLLAFNLRRKLRKEGEPEKAAMAGSAIPGEVNAAIATAIYLYLSELHDHETAVLTITKAAKTYSPWNSKIYNVTHFRRF